MSDELTRLGDGDHALQVVWGGLQSLLAQAVSGNLDEKRIAGVKSVIELASSIADVEEKMSRVGLNRARSLATIKESGWSE